VSQPARHHDVAPQLPLVALRNKDAAIVSIASTKGVLIDLARRAIVITMLVLSFERVETAREMNRAGGRVGYQFNERRSACGRSNWLPSVRAAAAGEKRPDEDSCDGAVENAHWATDRVRRRASIRIRSLPLPATPTMITVA